MTKERNGTKDKSQICKVTVPLKLLSHWNLHLLPILFCRLNKRNIHSRKSLGNDPVVDIVEKMASFSFDIGRHRFVYCLAGMTLCFELQQSRGMDYQNRTHFAMKFIHNIWQTCTLLRNRVTLDVYMWNRYKVNFVVQCRQSLRPGKYHMRKNPGLLLSRSKNANLILACGFPELVYLCKVIFCKLHIPVRTPKWPPRVIFAGVGHGQ